MKRFSTLILLTSFALPSTLSAFQEPTPEIPISISGKAAHNAFLDWANSLEKHLPYPAQMHMDMVATLDMEDGGNGMTMDMDMEFDILLDSPSAMRTWGSVEVDMKGSGMDMDMRMDMQLATDKDGLRFLLDDHGFLEEELGTEIPKAFRLSPDRMDILGKMYLDFIMESMEMYGADAVASFRKMDGLAEIMHPASAPRIMLTAEGLDVVGWGDQDGKGRIQMQIDTGILEQAFGGQAMPFDISVFEDMVLEMVVDLKTGTLLHYLVEMELPMSAPIGAGSEIGMSMKMRIVMGSVDPSPYAPTVELPSADQVMVLDEHFDQFLPMIELVMEMQRQQRNALRGEAESEDDFDF